MSPFVLAALLVIGLTLVTLSMIPERISTVRSAVPAVTRPLSDRLRRRLQLAGLFDGAPTFVLCGVALGAAISGLLAVIAVSHPVAAVPGALVVPIGFYAYLVMRERQFLRRASGELVIFLNRIESSARSGMPVAAAYREAVDTSKTLKLALADSAARMAAGVPFSEALLETLDRLPLRMWRMFVRQVEAHEEAGGDLPTAISKTIAQVNSMLALQAEANAETAAARMEQVFIWVAIAAFFVLASLTLGMGTISNLWKTPLGIIMFIVGILVSVDGLLGSRRVLNQIDRRMSF